MSRMRKIRKAAPELLEASKAALCYFLTQEPLPFAPDEEKRQETMNRLRDAIRAAEPSTFDLKDLVVQLVCSPACARTIIHVLKDRAVDNEADQIVLDAIQENIRYTKQRAFINLGINHVVLRRLAFVLKTTNAPHNQNTAFERLIKQIEKEGLSQNAMMILAKMGL